MTGVSKGVYGEFGESGQGARGRGEQLEGEVGPGPGGWAGVTDGVASATEGPAPAEGGSGEGGIG